MNATYKKIMKYIDELNSNKSLDDDAAETVSTFEIELEALCERIEELELENKELKEKPTFLTIPEATKFMRISRKRIDEIIRLKEIPIIKYSSKVLLLDLKDIEKYINSKKVFYQTAGGENKTENIF